jgi:signal transduction histidine kinase/ActR/RegA family two-component response regulator
MENGIKKVIKGLGLYFYKLAEQSSDVFWVRSATLETQLYISPAFTSNWGYKRSDLYHSPEIWPNSIHFDDRIRVLRQWKECITDPENHLQMEYSYRIISADGEEKSISESLFPVFDDGELVGVAGISKLTSASQTKQHRYHDKFLELLEHDENRVYWLKDRNGDFSYLSQANKLPWGIQKSELKDDGNAWKRHLHPDDADRLSLKELLLSAQSNEAGQNIELSYRLIQSGSTVIWLKDTYYATRNSNGQLAGFSGYTEVITQSVHRERELNRVRKMAATANKHKSDFLAMLSHELRTPLNAILGMSQLMSTSNLSPMQKDQLDVIMTSGKSLLGSLGDLLDCAKLDIGPTSFKSQETELETFLNETISHFKDENIKQSADIDLNLEFDATIPQALYIDQDRMQQIVSNLLVNALRFTHAGKIAVKAKCLQQNKSEAVVCLTVEDSGVGIHKNELNQIFRQQEESKTVFTRNKDCLGLGLVIVRELVERMGGSLAVSSEPGQGSQFSCIIPMATQSSENKVEKLVIPEKTEKKDPSKAFDMHVLVVEDNPINQKITKIMLEQVGCRVEIADCGKQAIEKMSDEYDMVFMDIGLPDIDGFETTSRIRALQSISKHTPIVAMTAHVFNADRERCFQVGMDEVIAKPILREDLVSILKRWSAPVAA